MKAECTQWDLRSIACIRARCGVHLPRGSAVCPRAGPCSLCVSASQGGGVGSSPGSRGHWTRHCTWHPEDWSTEPTGSLFSGSRMSPRRTHHPPFAPAHGSLLTFNSGDFHYWLIFLSLFGDSEFPEGRNHDFLSFFPMVLCWRDTQQVVE